ncbi:Glycoside hydrolase, family 57 (fragment) [Candidatus Sulfotelmatobacter kueseliae]|uniref:Glycoside hydrolase, family 57 n=1 Tax=Candidatus Sulfotelmatobacter kueseliae TaxID=2042962 RepID=A0A2U3K0S8_9BACT
MSNVYQALDATPPDYLAQPITGAEARPAFVPQTAYIHPRVTGDMVRYFEWMGAAAYTADHRAGAMHGKQFLLDSVYAGIDTTHLYGRLDFKEKVPEADFELVVNVESWAVGEPRPRRTLRVDASSHERRLKDWKIENGVERRELASSATVDEGAKVALLRNFEFKLPLAWLLATPSASLAERTPDPKPGQMIDRKATASVAPTSKIRLRFSLWQNRLPVDSLPLEGWIELQVVSEGELLFGA